MTNIYCYCLFDGRGIFHGVYSSATAVHRDAISLCNQSSIPVVVKNNGELTHPSVTLLRNIFKGHDDGEVIYAAGPHEARIIKTKLKE